MPPRQVPLLKLWGFVLLRILSGLHQDTESPRAASGQGLMCRRLQAFQTLKRIKRHRWHQASASERRLRLRTLAPPGAQSFPASLPFELLHPS